MTVGDFLSNVLTNVVANLATIIVGACIWLGRRRPLMRFFGTNVHRRFSVYWSFMQVLASKDYEGTQRNFQGIAITASENMILPHLQALLNVFGNPGPGPSVLRRLFLADVVVSGEPLLMTSPPGGPMLVLGSPGYNPAAKWCENNSAVASPGFANGNSQITVPGVPPVTSLGAAFVQRVSMKGRESPVFYAAGLAEAGTISAALYLLQHWRELQATYGDSAPFWVLIEATNDLFKPSVIAGSRVV